MAFIVRGRRKGERMGVDGFCNDWFSLQDGDIVGCLSIQLEPAEIVDVLEAKALGQTGTMFDEFKLADDGTFSRVKTKSEIRQEILARLSHPTERLDP